MSETATPPTATPSTTNTRLKGANASEAGIDQPWEQDNQAWWDWYVSLAENPEDIGELLDPGPLPEAELPSDAALFEELATPYALAPEQVRFFQEQSYIKLKGVLSPGAVLRLRAELLRLLSEAFGSDLDGGVQDRFLSLEMVWLDNPIVRAFVLSPRIAKISADLLGVPAVRLYHDNVLSKEPRCGRTPWHYDDHHFPLATHDVVTPWIPAQPIPLAMGPLAFAGPIDIYKLVESLEFDKHGTGYDAKVSQLFRERGVGVDESAFEVGEVSFHHNLNFHTAATNRTTRSRVVLANTFYADGARVMERPTMVSGDWQKFMPGVAPGEVAASELNPVCWPPQS
ncbi:MAG: phytanoyl-CoA dioxygenase family protein [Pseudomonadota bacterium]